MERTSEIINRMFPSVSLPPQSTLEDPEQIKADFLNETMGELKGYDCPVCLNRGFIAEVRNGSIVCVRCQCMDLRENLKRIERSGLSQVLDNYTLDKFQTPEDWQKTAKRTAEAYLANPSGHWFFIGGSVGAGKSHLCCAIAGQLLKSGQNVRYMLWRDDATKIKANVNNSEEYEALTRPLKTVKCLYIDDFFKAGTVTPADTNFAFELLNFRYNDRSLLTILSSEKTIEELIEIDEAIGSRIFERSKGFYIRISGDKNWRLK